MVGLAVCAQLEGILSRILGMSNELPDRKYMGNLHVVRALSRAELGPHLHIVILPHGRKRLYAFRRHLVLIVCGFGRPALRFAIQERGVRRVGKQTQQPDLHSIELKLAVPGPACTWCSTR